MHLTVHIFKKDARRLWWAIAMALALQACLVYLDGSRSDAIASLQEGWLNMLLPLAWACLIALAVFEDPLVGDRQFWVTRPYRWPVLLGSKLLFAAAFVHVPSLLADAGILALRGFQPWEWIPQLLGKQLLLASALTLPIIAMAALLENLAYLALATIAIAGATVYLYSFTPILRQQLHKGLDDARAVVFLVVLVLAAAAIIPMQFRRRLTFRSRIVGVAAVVVAELVLIVSPVFLARVWAAVHPAPAHIAVRLSARPASRVGWSPALTNAGSVGVALPVSISGIPEGVQSFGTVPTLDIIAPVVRYRISTVGPESGGYALSGTPGLDLVYLGPDWLTLRIRRPLYERLEQGRVELKGTAVVAFWRTGQTTRIPLGASRTVAGAGRCSSQVFEVPGYSGERAMFLKVVCESPAGFPLAPFASLSRPGVPPMSLEMTDVTAAGTDPSLGVISGPWLSPLDRVQVTSPLGLEPRAALAAGKLEITPANPSGWAVIDFELHDIRLSDYAVPRHI